MPDKDISTAEGRQETNTPKEPVTILAHVLASITPEKFYNGSPLPDRRPAALIGAGVGSAVGKPENLKEFFGALESPLLTGQLEESPRMAQDALALLKIALQDIAGYPRLYLMSKSTPCIQYAGPLLTHVAADHAITPETLFPLAHWLLTESWDRESFKLGLTLFSLFDVRQLKPPDGTNLFGQLLTVGLCPEFTYYVLRILSKWRGSQPYIYFLASHTTGWGKAFALRFMEPETQEAHRWLLQKGLQDLPAPAVSVPDVFHKSDLQVVLADPDMAAEDFTPAGELLFNMVQSGHLARLPQPGELLAALFVKAPALCQHLPTYITLRRLYSALRTGTIWSRLSEAQKRLVEGALQDVEGSRDWKAEQMRRIEESSAANTADIKTWAAEAGLGAFETLMALLRKNPGRVELYPELIKTADDQQFGQLLLFAEDQLEQADETRPVPVDTLLNAMGERPAYMGQGLLEKALAGDDTALVAAGLRTLSSWKVGYLPPSLRTLLQKIQKNTALPTATIAEAAYLLGEK